jgi:hypothetical protein
VVKQKLRQQARESERQVNPCNGPRSEFEESESVVWTARWMVCGEHKVVEQREGVVVGADVVNGSE